MDVIFEGSLSESWGIHDVLRTIIEVPNVPFGLLRVSSPEKNIQGKILVGDSTHIVGASCTGVPLSVDPYEAVRTMLELQEGNVAYLDLATDAIDGMDRSLFICISRVLEALPRLPENPTHMFDERTLLDKIFGPEEVSAMIKDHQQYILPMPIPKSTLRRSSAFQKPLPPPPISQWNVVESLFNSPDATHIDNQADSIDCCAKSSNSMIADYVHTPEEQRSSMSKLRTLPEPKPTGWQKVLKETSQNLRSALGLD